MKNKKGIIIASFGTTYEVTRKLCIESIEKMIEEKYEDYLVLRAFTSEIVRSILKDRDGLDVYNPIGALNRMKEMGIKEVFIQSLHIIPGYEYEKIIKQVEDFKKENEDFIISVGKPLLYEDHDFRKVIEGLVAEKILGEEPVVFMGHGTEHSSDEAYGKLERMFADKGYGEVFIGTVEGARTIEDIIAQLKDKNIKKVILRPFMLVAGDHAINDMASEDEASWRNKLLANGIEAEIGLFGLGEISAVRNLFLEHLEAAINS
ncbi:sirohydrochlorin cobaltochelatase [Lutispora saccharofermentans]|uniref:Sirohydrochlorin cobaltochelatase n=1 Tax=Lutispora saccharofermentans TaxID=3024236 RepID=A0ABT1NAR6_9FIRM|nr:sirohydrochlorin cobaltochelatase [Lutispora saccharofermentans]MCQ1528357.1 sirohydrochlorin cobaltochelatase [Lutispora saccharofermentans]